MKKVLGLSKKMVVMLLLFASAFCFAQNSSKMLITFKNNNVVVKQGGGNNETVEFGLTTNKLGSVNIGEESSQYPPLSPEGGVSALLWRVLPGTESHYIDDFRDKTLTSQVWVINIGTGGTNLTLDFLVQTGAGLAAFPGDLYLFGNPQNSDYATYVPQLITTGKPAVSVVPGGFYYVSYAKTPDSVAASNELTVSSGNNFGAAVANSKWRISKDGQLTWGEWKNPGDTVADLSGEIVISFDHVNGYATPPNYEITMDKDKSYMGVYLISLVNFEAVARFNYGTYAIDAAAKTAFADLFQSKDFWKVKNNTTGGYIIDSYLESFRFAIYNGKDGQKINLQDGSYTLEFPEVSGLQNLWKKPANVTFTVVERIIQGVATPIIGTYNVIAPATIVASPNESISVILNGDAGVSERLTVTVSAAPTTELNIRVSGTDDITFSETADGASAAESLDLVFSTTDAYPLTKSYYIKTLIDGTVSYSITPPANDFRYTNITLTDLTVNTITEAVDSELTLSPTALDFGTLKVNESLRQWIIVTNVSNMEKTVNVKTVGNSQFKTNVKVTDTKTIPANGSLAIAVDFKATGAGTYTDELILLTSGSTNVIAKCSLTATVSDAAATESLPRVSVSPAVIVKTSTDIAEGKVTYDLKVKVAAFANATTAIPFVITLPTGSTINAIPVTGFAKDDTACTISAEATLFTTIAAKTYTFNITTPVTSENIYPIKLSEALVGSATATMLLSDGQLAVSENVIVLDLDVNGSGKVNARDLLILYRYWDKGADLGLGLKLVDDCYPNKRRAADDNKITTEEAKAKIDLVMNGIKLDLFFDINGSGKVNARDLLILYRYWDKGAGLGLGLKLNDECYPNKRKAVDDNKITTEEAKMRINQVIEFIQ